MQFIGNIYCNHDRQVEGGETKRKQMRDAKNKTDG